jgi:hypothetical protein
MAKIFQVLLYGISVLITLMAAYSISAYVAGLDAMVKEFRSSRVQRRLF